MGSIFMDAYVTEHATLCITILLDIQACLFRPSLTLQLGKGLCTIGCTCMQGFFYIGLGGGGESYPPIHGYLPPSSKFVCSIIHLHNLASYIHPCQCKHNLTIFHSNPVTLKSMLTASYISEVQSMPQVFDQLSPL